MKTRTFTLIRLAFILLVVLVAVGVTGESRSTKANPMACFMRYEFQRMGCGVPETCDPGDIDCGIRNQPINACLDRAASDLFSCLGAIAPVVGPVQ